MKKSEAVLRRHLLGYSCVATVVVLAAALALPTFCAAPQKGPAEYLHLSIGNKWVLRSPTAKDPIVFEVIAEQNGSYDVRFDNPWIPSIMRIRPIGQRYVLESLTVNGQQKPLPAATIYWDFGAGRGQTWQNAIGKLEVTSRDLRVKGRQRTFDNCIQFQENTPENNKVFWAFAPGTGFVQFGEGTWAFVLDEAASHIGGGNSSAVLPPASLAASRPRARNVLIGLSANAYANEPLTPSTVRQRFEQSLSAGATYIYLSPKWDELEPSTGKYKLSDLDFQIGQSVQYNVPAVLNVRIVDTASRALPKDLDSKSFRDPAVRERLLNLLEAIAPHLRGRVQYMMIGNEIDAYFTQHRNQVAEYAELFQAGSAKMKQLVPGLQISTTITFDGTSQTNSLLKPLVDETDFFSVTYYPLTPDFKVRDPAGVSGDMSRILAAAGGKLVLLQEVGCPTSSLNDSSQDKQSLTFAAVLDELASHRAQFIGANFFLMSDLSDSVVNTLAQYYNLPNADAFKAFLKTLGMFDGDGHPKKSWAMFRQRAPAVNRM